MVGCEKTCEAAWATPSEGRSTRASCSCERRTRASASQRCGTRPSPSARAPRRPPPPAQSSARTAAATRAPARATATAAAAARRGGAPLRLAYVAPRLREQLARRPSGGLRHVRAARRRGGLVQARPALARKGCMIYTAIPSSIIIVGATFYYSTHGRLARHHTAMHTLHTDADRGHSTKMRELLGGAKGLRRSSSAETSRVSEISRVHGGTSATPLQPSTARRRCDPPCARSWPSPSSAARPRST